MEIKELHQLIDIERDRICIENSGLSFTFLRCGDSLSVNGFSPSGSDESCIAPVDGLEYCSETELLLTSDGRDFAARSRCLGGGGRKLQYVQTHSSQSKEGMLYSIEYIRDDCTLKVFSNYLFADDEISVVRRWVDVTNISNEKIGLEYVASVRFVSYWSRCRQFDFRLILAYTFHLAAGQQKLSGSALPPTSWV